MDDIVKQAMAKWPNVPDCSGWLGLDARGQWFMRDDATQAHGPFPDSKGSLLAHEGLIEFIGRNYGCDDVGQWFFQNGPQRVFVELEAAPWVLRIGAEGALSTHTGRAARFVESLEDEQGRVYIATDLGLGLVHSQDVLAFSEQLERQPAWAPQRVEDAALQARYGFVRSPQARAGQGQAAVEGKE